jgi:hypothetical protein
MTRRTVTLAKIHHVACQFEVATIIDTVHFAADPEVPLIVIGRHRLGLVERAVALERGKIPLTEFLQRSQRGCNGR